MQIIIITAADANYFELVRGTILSVREKSEGAKVAIGFFDLGCTPEQLQWLETQVNFIQKPDWDFDFPGRNEAPHYLKGLLARPFLRRYFPDFDIYLWIDADAWVQDWQAVELLVKGAEKRGLAVVPELDRGYYLAYGKQPWYWKFVYRDYQAAFGDEIAQQLHTYPTINAGIFALQKDAPHWELWAEYLGEGLQRHVSLMTDQIALNRLVYGTQMFDKTEMLPALCNWSCNFGLPVWDKQRACFVEPYLPHGAIGILHITGHKHDLVKLATTDGNQIEISLRYQPIQQPVSPQLKPKQMILIQQSELPKNTFLPGDYVSPGLKIILPDAYFPNMVVGDTNTCPWPYLRREIKHNWYVDRRASSVGFLSRDEAHILYNTALQFAGKKALEIGCWLGWSACHLALAGVELDVIDPLLEREDIRQSVIDSIQGALNASGVQTSVKLVPGYSPQKVEELANQFNRKWSLIFIDGEHGAPGPLNDAIVCEQLAEEDAIILFHDLAAPDVAQGLDYLKQRGWQTVIYQTMQIMGAAWRGNVAPVQHQPDPNISWQLPAHLQGYNISGISVMPQLNLPLLPQQSLPKILERSKSPAQNYTANFKNILSIVRAYTLLSESRLFSLYSLAKQICVEDLPGNFVECGTCKGGSAALIAFVIKHYSRRPRVLYAFDTFEGMPAPTEIDKHQGIPANLTGFGEGTLKAAISENLDKICELLQVRNIVVPVKGLFAQTLPKYKSAIGSIAFLHADGDWYESTMDIFNTLYDSVIANGLIQVDDYGHWEGCKQALHDFEKMKGESFSLQRIDETGVWFQKIK